MVRKFIKIFKKPYFIFFGTSLLILILGKVQKIELQDSALDINIHDTYFVIAHNHFISFASILMISLGIIYIVLEKFKVVLNLWLNVFHTLLTTLGIIFILYPFSIVPYSQYEGFPEYIDLNVEITFAVIIIFIVQFLFLTNLISGIIKLKKRT